MARPVPMSGVFSERVYFSAFLVSDSLFQLSEASTLYEGSRLFLVPLPVFNNFYHKSWSIV
jgi:hypothetical protein